MSSETKQPGVYQMEGIRFFPQAFDPSGHISAALAYIGDTDKDCAIIRREAEDECDGERRYRVTCTRVGWNTSSPMVCDDFLTALRLVYAWSAKNVTEPEGVFTTGERPAQAVRHLHEYGATTDLLPPIDQSAMYKAVIAALGEADG